MELDRKESQPEEIRQNKTKFAVFYLMRERNEKKHLDLLESFAA